jgi:hypothetical protein
MIALSTMSGFLRKRLCYIIHLPGRFYIQIIIALLYYEIEQGDMCPYQNQMAKRPGG